MIITQFRPQYFPKSCAAKAVRSPFVANCSAYKPQACQYSTRQPLNGPMSTKRMTIPNLMRKFKQKQKISMITAYDFNQACLVDKSPIDMVLVGDSVGMVMLGHESTIPVTMEDMIHHCKAVSKGAKRPILVGDLPFGSYEKSSSIAFDNAVRLIKEGGVQAIKMEGGLEQIEQIKALTNAKIAVMGHIGLQPQSLNTLGSYRYVGKTCAEAKKLIADALALQEAGCFSIVLECVPEEIASIIAAKLTIPTIGIGAGRYTAGQVLVWHDILGLFESSPSFCRRYANTGEFIKRQLNEYHQDVLTGKFPASSNTRPLENANKILEGILSPAEVASIFPSLSQKSNNGNDSYSLGSYKASMEQFQPPARILIVGSGSMAMLLAAKLQLGVQKQDFPTEITIYDPLYDGNIASIHKEGLKLTDINGNEIRVNNINTFSRKADLSSYAESASFDVVFLTTKSYQLEQLSSLIDFKDGKTLSPSGIICTLQNGMLHESWIKAHSLPSQKLLLGATANGATTINAGHVKHCGIGSTHIVDGNGSLSSEALLVRNLLEYSEFNDVTTTPNRNVLVEKLIVNSVINPITALLNAENGVVANDKYLQSIIPSLVAEGVRCLANHIDDASKESLCSLTERIVSKVKDIASNTATNRSSMLQDLDRENSTEIQSINGYIVKESEALGLEAPMNSLLLALIEAKSRKAPVLAKE